MLHPPTLDEVIAILLAEGVTPEAARFEAPNVLARMVSGVTS